ncbi:MAG: sulfur carrier protein ThiS [Nitrospirae bacterium]|nr:sulfur carrier protein ThiS [Nitrospirota bacterium]
MQMQVNGEQRTVLDGMTVAGLLKELDIRPDRVAVELNLTILERSEFDRRSLQEGDRIEIISFIGGGSCQQSAVSLKQQDSELLAES